ncbi:MAG: glucose-1-phosphate cytidylyltransferase [Puniceicoccales bacterium]|jgi:glucose-1-phosphate cytidylyltransferase|nr:glucose-1-phosphate cytidylyltransferase [Puniceicoccales bacterium]
MKTVILAGGLGTRLSEETVVRPKPMVEIGGNPILWHIMKIYSAHGIHDFIICAGYKGYLIKEYFANYFLHNSDVTFDLAANTMNVHSRNAEPWRVTVVDTGETTMTGGRLRRVREFLDPTEPFCLTYGDGVSDVDISALIAFHRQQGREATLTAVQPPVRFGVLRMNGPLVEKFQEKPQGEGAWINGGFFVLNPSVLNRIEGDSTVWEQDPMETLARDNQLAAYKHTGFWQPMDTLREKLSLEALWNSGKAPWKKW